VTAAPLNPGEFVEGLQVERLLSHEPYGFRYLVSDTALGTRFELRECFPDTHALRSTEGSVTAVDTRHQGAFDAALERFRASGQAAAALSHPGLQQVLRHFQARGTAWHLLPLQAGEPLSARLASDERMAPDAVRKLMLSLMDTLQYVHGEGFSGVGLTPARIYMDASETPRVAAPAAADDATPGPYSAPELLKPDPQPTPRIDIYALAAVIYHCIIGRAPSSAVERAAALADGRPDPLADDLQTSTAAGYGGLGEVIEQGLRLDPEQRPASIADWQRAFASVDWRRRVATPVATEPVASERPEWLAPMLLGGALGVLVLVTLYLIFADEPPDEPPTAAPAASAPPPASAEETARWRSALQADTALGYRRFMSEFPDSVYREQASVQLEILDQRLWDQLSAEDNRAAYQDYLEQFPGGLHEAEALQRIEAIDEAEARAERARQERLRRDELAWREALDGRSVASMQRYLDDWPAGAHVEEAQQLRRELRDRELENRAWDAARKLATRDSYQAYLDAYPRGEHAAEALIILEHLDLAPGKLFRDCTGCPAMMVVPAGAFWQGSADDDSAAAANEKPRRLVQIARPFAVGIHEVTFGQWELCAAEGGCPPRPEDNGWGRDDRPVIMVSWNDAQQFVNWLSNKTGQDYRLPSESEWEYFARAGEEAQWLGGAPQSLCAHANIAGAESGLRWQLEACSDARETGTLPAGSLQPNGFGLYDVIGNVAEWTADCMSLSYLDAPTDGSAWTRGICSSHMTRGGSWLTGGRESRLAARFSLSNADRNDFTGFRVVRTVPE
jgi:formylglycine-generating enzyme required for sulfatase activity